MKCSETGAQLLLKTGNNSLSQQEWSIKCKKTEQAENLPVKVLEEYNVAIMWE
jgi:hypothetical protein